MARLLSWLRVVVLTVAVLAGGYMISRAFISIIQQSARSQQPQALPGYRFLNSSYRNHWSTYIPRQPLFRQPPASYPLTNAPRVNQFITHYLTDYTATRLEPAQQAGTLSVPATQRIRYQITHQSEHYVSIIVHVTSYPFELSPPLLKFWTFDRASGQPITTKQLFGDREERPSAALAEVQRIAADYLKQHQMDSDVAGEAITAQDIEQFVVLDTHTIGFPLQVGTLLPISDGPVGVAVSVKTLMNELQNPLARAIFNVPALPKPTPPVPNIATASQECLPQQCLAITFDDGPGPYTEQLLETLRHYNAKATFFVIGRNAAIYENTLRHILSAGHQIGNHTWHHPDLTKLDAAAIEAEIVETNSAVHMATGQAPTIVRPPYGAINQSVLAELGRLGMASIFWSVDTRDWADRNSAIVCQRAVEGARPGSIILLHDIHKTSVEAVPCILSQLSQKGFRFVTVRQLIGHIEPGRNYTSG